MKKKTKKLLELGTLKRKVAKKNKGKKRIRIWTFSNKLLALCLLPMVIVCMLISILSTTTISDTIDEEVLNSLQIVAASVNEIYTNLYEGDYTVDFVGKVRKGTTEINGNFQLVDALKEKTGFEVSMLFGNTRLITTVPKENGARATGIPTDKEIYKRIEAGETIFLKNYTLLGRECYVYYDPLINSDGSIIGAIEVVKDSASINAMIRAQINRIAIFTAIFVIFVGLAVGILARGMVVRMTRIGRFLQQLIEGRLDFIPDYKTLKVKDELGDIYRNCVQVQETFKHMVSEIKISCDNLKQKADSFLEIAQDTSQAANIVRVAVEEISNGARNQADSTVSANDNIAKMSGQIHLITQEVDSMAESAINMSQKEKESVSIIDDLSYSSDHTKDSIAKVEAQIMHMNLAVENIKQAVEMIQEIAEETDLLSLNASIEAARAGEAGKGFAVVAEQICKLALQSNESGKEIDKILGEITKTAQTMVAVMNEVRSNMDVQQKKLEETHITSKAVSEGVDMSLQNISSIKEKIDILNISGEEINSTVEDLAAISEENASAASNTMEITQNMNHTMQTVKEASEELLLLADKLKEVIGSFVI
ncbi:MAG: cache domain-containing protein [Lachnospiraceae bacterium]|nr:cache domain-containing protein [Lachnospiraceae bacterium]